MRATSLLAAFTLALASSSALAQTSGRPPAPPATPAPTAPTAAADPVVARVGGEEIRGSDLAEAAQGLPEELRGMPPNTLYPLLLDQQIDRKILVLAARKAGLPNDPAVQRQVARATETALQNALLLRQVGPGLTEEAIRARYERDVAGKPGEEEVRAAKRTYGWPEDAQFLVPDGVRERFAEGMGARGARLRAEWIDMLGRYREQYPELARELDVMESRNLPDGWDADIPAFPADAKGLATRDSSQKVLNAIAPNVPWLLGGAADLAPSTKTNLTFQGARSFQAGQYDGRNLHFGIREHAMGAIANGLALPRLRPYVAGFLIFSDYMKPPIRLSAIM